MATELQVHPQMGNMLIAIRCAMPDFFALLCYMPYIKPGALRTPPPEGWQNIGDTEIRAESKTEDRINFVKHLPCLVYDIDEETPFLIPQIKSLYVWQEETCKISELDLIKTLGHFIWIGRAAN